MSTTIAALIFLPCAPVAMGICHWWSKRRAARRFTKQVEVYLSVRSGRG